MTAETLIIIFIAIEVMATVCSVALNTYYFSKRAERYEYFYQEQHIEISCLQKQLKRALSNEEYIDKMLAGVRKELSKYEKV